MRINIFSKQPQALILTIRKAYHCIRAQSGKHSPLKNTTPMRCLISLLFFLSANAFSAAEMFSANGSGCSAGTWHSSQDGANSACEAYFKNWPNNINTYTPPFTFGTPFRIDSNELTWGVDLPWAVTVTDSEDIITNGYHFHEFECNAGYEWTNITHQCVLATCPEGQVWDPDLAQCELESPPINEPKNNGEPPCPALTSGNPVHLGTGNKFEKVLDYQGAGAFALNFQRYYNSDASVVSTQVGAHWRHSYDRSILFPEPSTAQVQRADGKVLQFTLTGSRWSPDVDITDKLEAITDGWRYTTADDTTEDYDLNGTLITITNRAGQIQTLRYDLTAAEGGDDNLATLDKVTGPFGRALKFQYTSTATLEKMIDPAGNEIRYSRDANDNLIAVTYPDDSPADLNNNPQRLYHYEDLNYPNALTGLTDETGSRFASWGYDSQGRAIFSEHAGGIERVDITYNADGTVTTLDALGHELIYTLEIMHGVVKFGQIDGGPCPSCGGLFQQVTYDGNGFIASKTDFNGNTTTYQHNARGLEISRTEGSGTADERSISTDWHPDYRVPIKITEPGRITEFSYDAQGRLLSRKVVAP